MHDELVGDLPRGKRLVVQLQETFREKMAPGFVDKLDAAALAENAGLDLPPVMIYSDDLTHIVTEEGIAVAGVTEVGMAEDPDETAALTERGIFKTPADLGIDVRRANRDLLAAKSVKDLVNWSGGLYNPPAKFRNW